MNRPLAYSTWVWTASAPNFESPKERRAARCYLNPEKSFSSFIQLFAGYFSFKVCLEEHQVVWKAHRTPDCPLGGISVPLPLTQLNTTLANISFHVARKWQVGPFLGFCALFAIKTSLLRVPLFRRKTLHSFWMCFTTSAQPVSPCLARYNAF